MSAYDVLYLIIDEGCTYKNRLKDKSESSLFSTFVHLVNMALSSISSTG